jgi:hypothetical protein
MAASHPHMFQAFTVDESEIRKLVMNHFLLDRVVLQWHLVVGEDIPTPNTNEIVVFSSFFQRGFGLPTYDFLCRLLDHYQIELVHLNPNSILHIAIFVHLCESFLGIPPNFSLFKNYFFLKYHPSVANCKVIGGVGLQTCPRAGFFDLLMKTSLQGWHMTWFYCENHEPNLPSFIGHLPEFQGSWSEEPTLLELPHVAALTNKINLLKEHHLTGVCMAAHWLACRAIPLKKPVHPGWEYSGVKDPTRETNKKITPEHLVKLLEEMFQDTSSWPTDEQVHSDHTGEERDLVRRPGQCCLSCVLEILHLFCLNADIGQLHVSHSRL